MKTYNALNLNVIAEDKFRANKGMSYKEAICRNRCLLFNRRIRKERSGCCRRQGESIDDSGRRMG